MDRLQHRSNNAVLGAPKGMSNEECTALPVTRVIFDDGVDGIVSYWTPTDGERALLAADHPIRLTVLGAGMPPVALGVEADGLMPQIEG